MLRCSLDMFRQHVGEAHTGHGATLCADKKGRRGDLPSDGQPRLEILSGLFPQRQDAMPTAFALNMDGRCGLPTQGRHWRRD